MKTKDITCEIENETVQTQLGEDRHSLSREEADELYLRIDGSSFEGDEDDEGRGGKGG